MCFCQQGVRTGLVPLRIEWRGRRLCPDTAVRVITPGPALPRLVSVSDGTNLLSLFRIESGQVKATIDEVESIDSFSATVDGMAVTGVETFRTDPLLERYEVNFRLPSAAGARRACAGDPHGAAVADAHGDRSGLKRDDFPGWLYHRRYQRDGNQRAHQAAEPCFGRCAVV